MVTAAVLLTVAFLLLCIIAARQIALKRRILALRDPKRAGKTAWRWFLQLLEECGADITVTTAADLSEEAHKACSSYLTEAQLEAALDAGKRLRYSAHGLTTAELKALVRTCRNLSQKLYQNVGPFKKLYLKWIRHDL